MHIALVALPDSLSTSITLPAEMLQGAVDFMHAKKRAEQVAIKLYGLPNEANEPWVSFSGGIRLAMDGDVRTMPPADLVVIASRWRSPLRGISDVNGVLESLKGQYAQGAKICTVGSGSYLLAEAGLLRGLPATTHWRYFENFSRKYPNVLLKRDYLITESNNIYCAGSLSSAADMTVHLIEEFFGADIAAHTERQFSPETRRRYSHIAYRHGRHNAHGDEAIALAQAWLSDHCYEPASLKALSEHCGLHQRTLNRRFKAATGFSPMEYLHRQRMEQAQILLGKTDLSVGEIASRLMCADPSRFSRQFKERTGQTPVQYRNITRQKLFKAEL